MTKRYFVTGNFSKYIPFGAKRIYADCDDKQLKLLAFKKDSKTVIIVINDIDSEKQISLDSDALMVVTNETDDLKQYRISREAVITKKSVNTIILEGE